MSPVGSVNNALAPSPLVRPEGILPAFPGQPGVARPAAAPDGFGRMLDGLVATVDGKETQAADLTRRVLLGESDQLHQSVIAMQEASVAFSLMVEVRNKLVESYQELMRMQV